MNRPTIDSTPEISPGRPEMVTPKMTSLRSMKALHRILAARFSARRVLIQTQGPKNAVLATFRAAGDAVLRDGRWQVVASHLSNVEEPKRPGAEK